MLFKPPTILECIHQLKEVILLLEELDRKYNNDIKDLKIEIKNTEDKKTKIFKFKKIKLLEYHKSTIQKRVLSCQEKQYYLENLKIASVHIDILKKSTATFKTYMRQNDVDKIEQIQDDFADLVDKSIEIQNIVTETIPSYDLPDDDELEKELETMMVTLPSVPTDTIKLTENIDDEVHSNILVSTPLLT